jgi:hypothetical protein
MRPDSPGVFGHPTVLIGFELQNKPDIVSGVPRRNVHMKMEDRLAGDAAIVREDVETVNPQSPYQRSRHDLGSPHDGVEILLPESKQICGVVPGDDQGVAVMNGVDIQNGDHPVIAPENFGGKFPCKNTTENAMGVRHLLNS